MAELPIATRPLLPGGRAPIEATWTGVPWIGVYRYDLRVASPSGAGDGERASARASGWFVALPPLWVLLVAGALLVLAVVASRRRRAIDDVERGVADDDAWLDEHDVTRD